MSIKNPLILLVLCWLCPALLSAQAGDCVFFSTSGDKFHVALDNKFQNANAGSNVKVQNVPEGDYWITIMFDDAANKKAFKSNVRILANKETSFTVEQEGGNWKLNEYSSVPKSQVKTLAGQIASTYNRTGVEVKGLKSADQMSKDMVHTKTEINRVQGMREDPASKRMGKYSGGASDVDPAPAATAPQAAPETGTFTVSEYVQLENADGTTSIVEERTTTIKEIVDRGGQKQLRTKKSKMQYPTDFTCLPMKKEAFLALKESVSKAPQDTRSAIAQNGVKDQCMTPGQLKALGDLILSEVDRNNFAVAAKPTCADPKKFPFVLTEPIAAVENEKTVHMDKEPVTIKESVMITKEEKEEVIEEKPKTKAELKAELKALKKKEKEAKKAAKAKAKAEKAAAKAKAKAEKAAAKAAAKKAKEDAKKKK